MKMNSSGQPAKDFVITRVDWHTGRKEFLTGLPVEDPKQVRDRFRTLIDFLERNQLLVRPLLRPGAVISDDFELRRSDLTDEGFAVIQAAYDRWLRALERRGNRDPENVSILEKALMKLREPAG